jgi:hypothetical protein
MLRTNGDSVHVEGLQDGEIAIGAATEFYTGSRENEARGRRLVAQQAGGETPIREGLDDGRSFWGFSIGSRASNLRDESSRL